MTTVNVLTDWRVALKALLKTAFPNAELLDGERPTGLSRDKMRICVFVPSLTQWDPDGNMAQPAMTIRVWMPLPRNQQDMPRDPAPIEQAMIDFAHAIQPKVATLGAGPDFFQVSRIAPDYNDEYGFEADLIGWMRNPMMIGG